MIFSRCNSHPATRSFQPVRRWWIGAAVEAISQRRIEAFDKDGSLGDSASRSATGG
jgi:hypothetical protein